MQSEVITLVYGFAHKLATYVEGTPDDNGIHQVIRSLNKSFFDEICYTAPKFSPFTRGPVIRYTHPVILPPDDEPDIYANELDVICVDEAMDMGDK